MISKKRDTLDTTKGSSMLNYKNLIFCADICYSSEFLYNNETCTNIFIKM